jgi:dolichol-phosphate mannosyltransferase
MNEKTLSVILPTYDEKGNICKLITTIFKVTAKAHCRTEIIVVDDNSPDGTAEVVKRNFAHNPHVRLLVRKKEKGLATAIKHGLKMAKHDLVLVMDTDFNHDPAMIPIMISKTAQKTLIIGSRYVKGGGMENKLRQWLSNLFNIYIRILLNHQVHDNLSGFFLLSKNDLKSVDLNSVFYGFGDYFIRLIYMLHKQRYTIVEVPVFYRNRTQGVSKSKFFNMFLTYTQSAIKLRLNMV